MSYKRGNITIQELDPPCELGDIVDDFVRPRVQDMVRKTGRSAAPHERRTSIAFDEFPEVTEARIAFLSSLRKLQEKQGNVNVDVVLDPNRCHDWDGVVQALRDAEMRYLDVGIKGPQGRIRECLRRCEGAKGGVESWLRLLPSESWQGSLLCGGLKIIVGVAAQIGGVRNLVAETIEQIPLTIETAFELYQLYPDDVRTYVGSVLASAFGVMKECIDFFARNPVKKFMAAAGRGTDYGKSFVEKVAAMEKMQKRMEAKASLAKQHADHDSRELLRDVAKRTEATEKNTQALTDTMRDMLGDAKKRFEIENELLRIQNQNQQNQLQTKMAEALAWKWRHQTLLAQNSQRAAQQHREWWLQFLAYDENVKLCDLHSCLRIGHTLSNDAQSRASNLLHSAKVQKWLGDETSGVLVINAMDRTGLTTHSTASYFSALLLVSLDKIARETQSVAWFCGQHSRDINLVPMLANWVGQLLAQGLEDVEPQELQPPSDPAHLDFRSLTAMFLRLLQLQLRESPVYCVIDSISWYEDYQRLGDLIHLWVGLASLVKNHDPKLHPLKVLATSPLQCTRIGSQYDSTKPNVYWANDEASAARGAGNFLQGAQEVH